MSPRSPQWHGSYAYEKIHIQGYFLFILFIYEISAE